MNAALKVPKTLLDAIREDLQRPHSFAFERVGFLTAGAAATAASAVTLFAREYHPVADGDYVRDSTVGAKIGQNAMSLAALCAHQSRASLLHVHMHGGYGQPEFSHTDLVSGRDFAPGFFGVVPRMPHGLLVLSADSATGLLWFAEDAEGTYIHRFIETGVPSRKWERA